MNQQAPGEGERPTRPTGAPNDNWFQGAPNAPQLPPQQAQPPSYGPPPQQPPPPSGKRPGLALAFTAVGSLALLASLFLPWFETKLWISYVGDEEGPIGDDRRTASPFTAVSAVKDVTGPDPSGPEPGILAHVLLPWLAVLLVLTCCVLACLAAYGWGQQRRSKVLRLTTGVALLVTAVLVVLSTYDLGVTNSPGSNLSPEGEVPGVGDAEVSSIRGYVDPYWTIAVAAVGAVLLAIATLIGPRFPRQPSVAQAWFPGAPVPPAMPGPGGAPRQFQQFQPGQQPPPGWIPPHPGAMPPAGPGMVGTPGHQPQFVTQLAALILTGVAAVLCFAGYVFLPWGRDVSFNDISDATREFGLEGKPVTEAYFAWLAWLLLLMALAVAVGVAVGKRPGVVNAKKLRPYLAGGSIFALLIHLWVMIDLNGEGADLGVGTYAVALGLLLAVVGTLLPLRMSAPMSFGPPPGYPPQPPQQPPFSPGTR